MGAVRARGVLGEVEKVVALTPPSPIPLPVVAEQERERDGAHLAPRTMGMISGEFPAWMVPMRSNPWRA
jgi:hypothetical protein